MNNGHKVLARKYRPSSFSDLLGQDVLVTTMTNAILHNKLHHAYLLHGIRGVGKTTSARIIANVLNCSEFVTKENSVTACGKCSNCLSFTDGSHPDIIEFDAASKTGVDDIRDVLSNCEYRPILGKYKIFIIDEVHMLSKNAFNALLKMLEEPPAHIIFILATTELNKVPMTIISRCQKFDLQRISIEILVQLFEKICQKENIKYSFDALQLLAIKADGSARDGLSLLYHLSTLTMEQDAREITVNLINQALANIDLSEIIELFSYIIEGDAQKALGTISKAYKFNYDFISMIEELLSLIAYCNKKLLIQNYEDLKYKSYENLIKTILPKVNIVKLGILWQLARNGIEELKASYTSLILIAEMIILRMIATQSISSPGEIIKQTLLEQNQEIFSPESIYAFLDYLYNTRNFDLYHYLLNEVSIIKYDNQVLEISANNSKNDLNRKIAETLFSWTGQKWNVITSDVDSGAVSLKRKLFKQIEQSDDWKLLKNYFTNVKIIDVIHNKTCE